MKITKYVNSCLLAETPDRAALIDPGNFTWQSGSFDLSKIERVDRIIITHEHQDHMDPDFIKAVLKKFPEAHIVTNPSAQQILQKADIDATMRFGTGCSVPFKADHAPLEPLSPTPNHSGFHFKEKLTLAGDSHSLKETKDILAIALTAPWGSIIGMVNKVMELKPKVVIPIHDWHYSEEGREWAH